jgi:hypothetical protein
MKSASGKETKRSKGVDEQLAIFGDTPIPTTPDEIVTMVIARPWLETFDSYQKLAEHTLIEAGFVFESGDSEFHDRLLNDPALPAEVWEAAKLLWDINALKILNDLTVNILHDVVATGRVGNDDGNAFNLRTHTEHTQTITLEIGALGERIKGRRSEADALWGREVRKRWKRGQDEIARQRSAIRKNFMSLFRAEQKRSKGTGRKRPQMFESTKSQFRERYPDLKIPSDSAAYSWTSPNRKRSARASPPK